MSFAKLGLLVGNGPVTSADLDVIRQAELEALKLRAIVNPASDLPIYRDLGIHTFLVQLLSPEPGERPVSPQEFVDYFAPALEGFVREGVRDFEIHGEPNRAERGYGVSWDSPAAFGSWFHAVADKLKAAFGPQIRAGFPGLTPPQPRQPGASPAIPQANFLAGCHEAIAEADFVCCHIYWDSADNMRAFDGGMRFIRQYLETFPTVPLVISEFSNVNPNAHTGIKGDQYAEFAFTCAQYDPCQQDWAPHPASWPRVQAAYAFILRSPDSAYASQVWMEDNGQPRPVVSRVAERRRMPPPASMRFTWPTEFQYYTQYYGENQESYHENYNGLRGGHNGADLHVRYDDPASSPIRSCLDGVVTRRKTGQTGYGNHLHIQSQIPGVGKVTLLYAHMTQLSVEKGQRVQAGEVIGTAGTTGWSSGPHLHLGMRIKDVELPANNDDLNPHPYLEPLPAPRGQPRTPYERTYVLLPPGADAAWASAVVDGGWDEHRFTIGGSADDAGIGDLDFRRVIAVNPAEWASASHNGDSGGNELLAFFEEHYPGVLYVPLKADTPGQLVKRIEELWGK